MSFADHFDRVWEQVRRENGVLLVYERNEEADGAENLVSKEAAKHRWNANEIDVKCST